MTEAQTTFCTTCGYEDEAWRSFCANCGRPLDFARTGDGRVSGIAFLLNEARTPRLQRFVDGHRLGEMTSAYRAELATLTGRGTQATQAALSQRPRSRRAEQPVSPPAAAAVPPARPALASPPSPPVQRAPMDWSWLADQQANLFLFAGAFLVVVAALIFVAYSGQTISGALKMSLLAVYTVAFLGAGVVCLRLSRVRMAGQVFFGVGAVLVPLNFVAAYNIFSASHLSPEALWLAGSLVTASFYSAVALTGIGRHYAFAGGVAIVSAALAAAVIAGMPLLWLPVPMLTLAVAISLADVAAPATLHDRLTSAWLAEARVLAAIAFFAAAASALVVALASSDAVAGDSRWFLLCAAVPAFAFYASDVVVRGQRDAMLGASATFATIAVGVVFGFELAPEHYALALIAAGAAGLLLARLTAAVPEGRGYADLPAEASVAALMLVTAGVSVAVVSVLEAANPNLDYAQQWHWSLLAAFAAAGVAYAAALLAGAGRDHQLPGLGSALMLVGAATAVVYGAGWSTEYYAVAFVSAALLLLAIGLTCGRFAPGRIAAAGERRVLMLAHATAATGALVMLGAIYAAAGSDFALQTRWSVPSLFSGLAVFYALAAIAQPEGARDDAQVLTSRGSAFAALIASLFVAALGVVYALDASAEYYAFALVVPALVFVGATYLPDAPIARLLPPNWRESLVVGGRLGVAAGCAVALAAALAAGSRDLAYSPDSRAFLPIAFGLAAAFFAIDAARPRALVESRGYGTSVALLTTAAVAALGVAYASDAAAPWYGVALAAVGVVYGFGLRAWAPAWLHADAREHAAIVAVTGSWLPFERAYVDAPQIAAGVHLAAAAFYGLCAFTERRRIAPASFVDNATAGAMSLAPVWLYAAGLTIAIGYLDVLRALPGTGGTNAVALPVFGLAVAFAAAGVAARRWRPEFRLHLYVIALLVDVAAIAAVPDTSTLAIVLTLSAAASIAVALVDDAPMLALPAAVAVIGAIAAWEHVAGAPSYLLPAAYAGLALLAYAAGFALRRGSRRWAGALRACGAAYALLAPTVGFATLAAADRSGGGQTALYEWSTLAVALVGVLALVESSIAKRGWVVVVGSGVLLVSLLLQIAHLHPASAQPYAVVIGLYLVLLGTFGLWRFRLIPEAREAAPYIEALGAVVVMLPSFAQSLDAGRYALILLAEAIAFFAAGVILRRRGMLATAVTALVLVAARVLFDAVNALPNWIVVLIAGMALLGVGMGILLGRERWGRWQEIGLGWWDALSIPDDAAERTR